jgi:hypothetical protein
LEKRFIHSILIVTAIAASLLHGAGVKAQELAFSRQIIEKNVVTFKDTSVRRFVHDPLLYHERWDTLAQPMFWRVVIGLSQDSCILNVASNRKILGIIPSKEWHRQTEPQKSAFKDSLRRAHNLPDGTVIYVTAGKKEFYSHKVVVPSIDKAIEVFNREGTDPWYAQVILLIESPGKMQKSSAGAYGAFQLMKSVARKYGLRVDKYVDEREDFEKSAMAAARLLGRVCVPEVKKILDNHCIAYREDDLWFRLLVLHAYHAGSGNVAAVINKISPTEGGIPLIRTVWQTEAGGFKNSSQNYSQVGLASLLRFDEMVYHSRDTVFLVEGDASFNRYKSSQVMPVDTLGFLALCMQQYSNDLLDGTLPVDQYITRISMVEREFVTVCTKENCTREVIQRTITTYLPGREQQMVELGKRLMGMYRTREAIEVLKVAAETFPNSSQVHATLAEAYSITGQKPEAIASYKKALALNPMDEASIKALSRLKGASN